MVLVTGAAGFVGGHLVKGLIENGYKVRALLRNPEKCERFRSSGVELVKGDMTDAASLSEAARGTETVINLVGIFAKNESAYRAVHTEGTRNLAKAAKESGARKFIYISANGASKDGITPYFRTKWEAEEEARNSGTDYTIFRPSVIFGAGDSFVNQLAFGMRMSPVFPVFGTGRYEFQPIYVSDLVQCIIKSITEPGAKDQTVEMGGPDILSFDGIIDAVAEVIGKRVYKMHIPLPMVKAAAKVMETFLPKPPISPDQLKMMELGNTCDISKMKEIFGIKPVSFKDGIKRFL